MGYRLSRQAEEDIIELFADGIERFGNAQAERYQAAIEQQLELLAQNPRLGRQRPELVPAVRILPVLSHIIIYMIADYDEVFVVRVRHKREDWEADDHNI